MQIQENTATGVQTGGEVAGTREMPETMEAPPTTGNDIRIDDELSALIPPLNEEERQQLEDNLKVGGCRDPLVVWQQEGVLLDGHNRLKICKENDLDYQICKVSLPDRLAAKIWIRENQAGRRNLTDDQRAMNAAALSELLSEQAKTERAAKGTPARKAKKAGTLETTSASKVKKPRSRAKAAKVAKVSERKIRLATHIRKTAPDLAAKVDAGELSLNKADKEIFKRKKAAALAAVPDNLPAVTDRYRIFQAKIHEAGTEVADASVDLVLTLPCYCDVPSDFHTKLSDFASRVLKPGGSLFCMTDQHVLPYVLEDLTKALQYHWVLACLMPPGQTVPEEACMVKPCWRPMLWFVKTEYEGDWVRDVYGSTVNDKDKQPHFGGWPGNCLADILECFTQPGQTICDPCCGDGTTGAVAIRKKRLFVGFDNNIDSIKTTRSRLAEVHDDEPDAQS